MSVNILATRLHTPKYWCFVRLLGIVAHGD
jgi:hypothetical protein